MTTSHERARFAPFAYTLCILAAAAMSACGGGAGQSQDADTASAETVAQGSASISSTQNALADVSTSLSSTSTTTSLSSTGTTTALAPTVTSATTETAASSLNGAAIGDATATGPVAYGAHIDAGETDDPLVDGVAYSGQVYYVDCVAGDDSKDGRTPSTAWKTVAQVNTKTSVGYWDTQKPNSSTNPQFHAPWTAAPSGSAFLFKRGCSFDGFINVHAAIYVGSVATYAENITFGAYGSRTAARPKISYITTSSLYREMLWSNSHTVHVRNLQFVGNLTATTPGIWLNGSKDSSFENSSIDNVYGDGINGDNTANLLVRNSTISRTQVSGGLGGGLVGSGNNLRILNSTFVNNGKNKMGAHNIYVRHLTNSVIEGNSLSGGSNLGIVLHGSSTGVTIRGNDIFGNSNGIDVTGGYSETEVFDNIVIERNRIRDNGYRPNDQGYGLLLKSMVNSSIRNNLVYGNRLGAVSMADANVGDAFSSNVQIYQNLFQDPSTGSGVVFTGPALSRIDVRNNIFVQMSSTRTVLRKDASVPETALVLNNNLYAAPLNTSGKLISYNGSNYTLDQLTAMTGKEAMGKQVLDPQFVNSATNDYRVQSTSPARKLGAPIGVPKDFINVTRDTTAPTVGAYE